MTRSRAWSVLVLLLLAACTGRVKGGQGEPGGTSTPTGGTNASGGAGGIGVTTGPPRAEPPPGLPPPADAESPTAMRRLSRTQYQAALEQLVRRALPRTGGELVQAVGAALTESVYPVDSFKSLDGKPHGGLLRTDQVVQQAHIDASFDVARKLATQLTENGRVGELLGGCATDADAANDDACLRDFIRRFGRWVVRRPMDDAEVAFYRAIVAKSPVDAASVADVLALLLTAPEFLYVIETGTPTDVAGRTKLTAHELATRLALHFWNEPPDDELAALAESGKLLDGAVYEAQVQRLAGDARAEGALREFFSQWLQLQDTPELHARLSDKTYKALVGSFTPTAETRVHAINEIEDLVSYLYRTKGRLSDVLTDNRAFARDADVATLYGVPPWDGQSTPAAIPGRNLLSRVAFVATGMSLTRPIMKGVRIRTGLLCQTLPKPPPAAMNAVVELAPDLTTREVLEQLTEKPAECAACHKPLINPLGYVTEGFDPLGRVRAEQPLFDADGKLVGHKPVRTDAVVRIDADDDRLAKNADDAAAFIAESGELERCFAQQYFRFAFGRKEAEFDRNLIEQLAFSAFKPGASLATAMQAIALRPEFQLRMSR